MKYLTASGLKLSAKMRVAQHRDRRELNIVSLQSCTCTIIPLTPLQIISQIARMYKDWPFSRSC